MPEIDLREIAERLESVHGIPAYVEQTGGGCATVYAGPFPRSAEYPPMMIGPGVFDWSGGPCYADTEDLSYGFGEYGEDGDYLNEGATVAEIAETCAAAYLERAHPRRLYPDETCTGSFVPHTAATGEPSRRCSSCGFVWIDFAEDEDLEPCSDCAAPVSYSDAYGYRHVDPSASPGCFLNWDQQGRP